LADCFGQFSEIAVSRPGVHQDVVYRLVLLEQIGDDSVFCDDRCASMWQRYVGSLLWTASRRSNASNT